MKFIVCQSYSQKAVKNTCSGTSNHQGPLSSTLIPVILTRPVPAVPDTSNVPLLPSASSNSVCPSKTRMSPASCKEHFVPPLTPTQRTEAATVLCKSIFIIQTEADPPKTRYPCHQNPSSTCTGLGPRNLSEYLLIVLLINLPLRDLPHKPTLHSVVPCP